MDLFLAPIFLYSKSFKQIYIYGIRFDEALRVIKLLIFESGKEFEINKFNRFVWKLF